jgi:hypothetical protein
MVDVDINNSSPPRKPRATMNPTLERVIAHIRAFRAK